MRDKCGRSLEIYKFYVSALHVAVTRAVSRVLIESDLRHPLLTLLQVPLGDEAEVLSTEQTSRADWGREARKLELQGKREQTTDTRRRILKQQAVPWEVWTPETLRRMEEHLRASPGDPKLERGLVDFALPNRQERLLETLRDLKVEPAASYLRNTDKDGQLQRQAVFDKYRKSFESVTRKSIPGDCDRQGADHRTPDNPTPLMLAAEVGNVPLIGALLERGADPTQTDVFGRTPHLLADRFVRLSPESAEFYFLSVMPAVMPIFQSSLHDPRPSPGERRKRRAGSFVDALRTCLEYFLLSVLREVRRTRSDFDRVLARAEVNSSYKPACRFWKRSQKGFYVLNPDRLKMTLGENGEWTSVALLTDPVARAWPAGHPEA